MTKSAFIWEKIKYHKIQSIILIAFFSLSLFVLSIISLLPIINKKNWVSLQTVWQTISANDDSFNQLLTNTYREMQTEYFLIGKVIWASIIFLLISLLIGFVFKQRKEMVAEMNLGISPFRIMLIAFYEWLLALIISFILVFSLSFILLDTLTNKSVNVNQEQFQTHALNHLEDSLHIQFSEETDTKKQDIILPFNLNTLYMNQRAIALESQQILLKIIGKNFIRLGLLLGFITFIVLVPRILFIKSF